MLPSGSYLNPFGMSRNLCFEQNNLRFYRTYLKISSSSWKIEEISPKVL